jgi:kynurenine formamidase
VGDSLLIRTGWSAYVSLPKYRDELPRISLELAQWCVTNQVKMLGVEPPSVADVNNIDELTAVHTVLFEGGIIIVEGLTNLEELTRQKVTFAAFPLKIDRGDGAPVRAVAIEDY